MSGAGRTDQEVALALAAAMLSGSWRPDALASRARAILGVVPLWLDALVEEILVLFPEPPTDRATELVDAVRYSEHFLRGAASARDVGRPLRAVSPRASGVPVPHTPWLLPELRDLQELASWLELSPGQLSWLSDPNGYQPRTRPGPLHLYDYVWIPRAGRPPRLLEAPRPILKRVQGELLHRLLDHIPAHPAAHGFVPGHSVLTHARHHLGAEVVITVDISDFFAAITPGRVAGVLRSAGLVDPVARTIAQICVTPTPEWVLRSMPAGGIGDQRYMLRTRLRTRHLPQGAPTSPALANLTCYHLDRRLTGYADAVPAVFSRYADDLSFSGGAQLRIAAPTFLRAISRIVTEEGFVLNPTKTRVQTRGQRQLVTGIVVNERPNVRRQDYDQLRAVLHEARTRGPETANRERHPDFRRHLQGRVEWVESVNLGRGQRLRSDLEAIRWAEPLDP